MYCLKCKAHTADKAPKMEEVKGRMLQKATCAQCGGAKRQFAKKTTTQSGKGIALDVVNLWRRKNCGGKARDLLPGEKHPGCYNYAGPGTVLNAKTLATKPYDAVDAVARTHDLAYERAFKMTDPQKKKDAIRAADSEMVSELKSKGLDKTMAAKAIGVKMKLEDSGKLGQTVVKTVVGKDYTGKGHRRRHG